jgi:uroporphyrinogen-III synthase
MPSQARESARKRWNSTIKRDRISVLHDWLRSMERRDVLCEGPQNTVSDHSLYTWELTGMSHNATIPPNTSSRAILGGKRVLVTRPQAQASDLVHRLQELGAVPITLPTIRIVAPADNYAGLDVALRQLATFDWAVFTSVNGVVSVWQRLTVLGLDAQAFTHLRLAAIGPVTAEALVGRGLRVEVLPDHYVAEALLSAIPHPAGQRFLLPRAAEARDTLHIGLVTAGAEVVEVHAYRTLPAELSPEALEVLEHGIDILTFTSSSTVRNFVAQVGAARAQALASRAVVVAIGPITANTAHELGLRVDAVASEYTIAGLVQALVAATQ